MKLRTLPLAVATAVVALVPLAGLGAAYAAPAAPVIDGIDSSTPGHVTGTVTTDQPFAFVQLASDVPATLVPITAGSGTFDLPTWGFGNGSTVSGIACTTDTPVGSEDCSAPASSTEFTPTDTDPEVSFSTDHTIGPDPADKVTLSVNDSGGGELFGQWDNGAATLPDRFAVDHAATDQVVATSDGEDGEVHLYRCNNANQDHCVEEAGSPSSTYQVRRTITAAIGTIAPVSSASPTTTFNVNTNVNTPRTGTYTVTWHLEDAAQPGTPIPGYGATSPSGGLNDGVAQNIPLDATGLPAGDYLVDGTITVVDGQFGTYTDVPMTGGTLHSGGDITPPDVTSIVTSPTKIYPLISGNSTYKSSTKITVTGAGVPDVAVVSIYQQSTNTLVRTRTLTPVDATHGTAVWDGRRYNGTPVSSGTYQIKVRDSAGNYSATVGTLVVSGYRLVTKTWTRTFTPAGTLADKYIGRCSTLRLPSLRGWYHSLGYYANTRCSSQTNTDSLISTLHSTFLPSKGVVSYVDIRVNVYGGAARAKPGSKARIRYLHVPKSAGQQGYWFDDKTVSSTLGTHAGYTSPASSMVFKEDNSFAWGFYTGFGYQYDVKSFTVVLHYKALG